MLIRSIRHEVNLFPVRFIFIVLQFANFINCQNNWVFQQPQFGNQQQTGMFPAGFGQFPFYFPGSNMVQKPSSTLNQVIGSGYPSQGGGFQFPGSFPTAATTTRPITSSGRTGHKSEESKILIKKSAEFSYVFDLD